MTVVMDQTSEDAIAMIIQQHHFNQLRHQNHKSADNMNSDAIRVFAFQDDTFAMDLLIADEVDN
jgi:hypothetical protein